MAQVTAKDLIILGADSLSPAQFEALTEFRPSSNG
jgi:hypothetical protein